MFLLLIYHYRLIYRLSRTYLTNKMKRRETLPNHSYEQDERYRLFAEYFEPYWLVHSAYCRNERTRRNSIYGLSPHISSKPIETSRHATELFKPDRLLSTPCCQTYNTMAVSTCGNMPNDTTNSHFDSRHIAEQLPQNCLSATANRRFPLMRIFANYDQ